MKKGGSRREAGEEGRRRLEEQGMKREEEALLMLPCAQVCPYLDPTEREEGSWCERLVLGGIGQQCRKCACRLQWSQRSSARSWSSWPDLRSWRREWWMVQRTVHLGFLNPWEVARTASEKRRGASEPTLVVGLNGGVGPPPPCGGRAPPHPAQPACRWEREEDRMLVWWMTTRGG
jgi:hypothetical protein